MINTGGTALTGASVTVSSIPTTYSQLYIYLSDIYGATDSQYAQIRFNSDSNLVYQSIFPRWNGSTATLGANNDREVYVSGYQMKNTDNNNAIWLLVKNYASTNDRKVGTMGSAVTDASSNRTVSAGGFHYDSTSAITSVTVKMESGNLSGGTIFVYGVK